LSVHWHLLLAFATGACYWRLLLALATGTYHSLSNGVVKARGSSTRKTSTVASPQIPNNRERNIVLNLQSQMTTERATGLGDDVLVVLLLYSLSTLCRKCRV